ncbi:MAG: hypothetical protein IJW83_03460 [Clostridia bacterium]|nr:hypothetical protein [Clostridia bacterium]
MKFFKENSYDIVKLYIQQIGISIFSLFLYFAVEAIPLAEESKTGLAVGLSVFSMLFFYMLLYTAAWDMGAKDKIRIDGGRMELRKGKGAWMACIANLPNFVLALLSLIFISLNLWLSADALNVMFVIFNFLLRVTTAMYNGLMQGIFGGLLSSGESIYLLGQTVGFLIVPVVAILVTHFGYTMGVKEQRIMKLFRLNTKE